MRNWSFAILEREERTNLLYRQFTRVGGGRVPDAKTLGRLAPVVGPDVVARLHQWVVAIARAARVVAGRKMRVDTTVVETNIHYPTDWPAAPAAHRWPRLVRVNRRRSPKSSSSRSNPRPR